MFLIAINIKNSYTYSLQGDFFRYELLPSSINRNKKIKAE